jgi:hypothetical protein
LLRKPEFFLPVQLFADPQTPWGLSFCAHRDFLPRQVVLLTKEEKIHNKEKPMKNTILRFTLSAVLLLAAVATPALAAAGDPPPGSPTRPHAGRFLSR